MMDNAIVLWINELGADRVTLKSYKGRLSIHAAKQAGDKVFTLSLHETAFHLLQIKAPDVGTRMFFDEFKRQWEAGLARRQKHEQPAT